MNDFKISRLTVAIALSAVLALIHNYLFYEAFFGVNTLVFSVLGVATLLFYAYTKHGRIEPIQLMFAATILAFSGFIGVFAADWLLALNVFALLVLYTGFVMSVQSGTFFGQRCTEFLIKAMIMPFEYIAALGAKADNSPRKAIRLGSQNTTGFVRGAVITIPVVAVIGALLASADSIFSDIFSVSLPEISLSGELVGRVLMAAILFITFLAVAKYILFVKSQVEVKLPSKQSARDTIEAKILLGALNVLLGLFTLVQIFVLSGGHSAVLSSYITYAEYAREGFFQLLLVGVLCYSVITVTSKFIASGTALTIGKLLQLGLIAQLLVVVASSWRRLSLYQDAFGWTSARLFAYLVLGILVALFIAFAYKIYRNKSDQWMFARYAVVFVSALLILNVFNPDYFVAKQNVDRFFETGKIDVEYLRSLSIDATAQKERLILSEEGLAEVQKSRFARPSDEATKRLFVSDSWYEGRATGKYDSDWRSSTLSEQNYRRISADYR